MTMTTIPPTPRSVLAQIVQLEQMTGKELQHYWKTLFNAEAPTGRKQLLVRRIAYELQIRALPKNKQCLAKENKERIATIIEDNEKPKKGRAKPSPGTVLSRIYQHQEYTVTVTENQQFNFNGELYDNLSTIARKITGTRWSGPLFFGLKKQKSKKGKHNETC